VVVLELLGHRGMAIDSGARALEVLGETDGTDEAFDLAIVDIGMPGMSGYELVAAMRRHPAGAKLPIVALTGWVSNDDQTRAKQAGFDLHLAKPVELPELQDLLRRVQAGPLHDGQARRGDLT
jgi:two-component system CheB/CheR fusion protein